MENAMTPQERQLIDDLFDRLAKLETAPRDAEAMSAIMQGLRSAPNAVYALVQTALVQDEALKRANSRIQELEAGHAPEQNQSGGFLDSMRDAIFGQNQPQGTGPQGSATQGSATQGSVPNVRAPGMGSRPVWNSGDVMQQTQAGGQQGGGQYGQAPQPAYGQPYGAPQPAFGGGGGGSFLGTAAAAAAGVVGGSLLLGSIRSMMGGGHQQAFGDTGGLHGGVEDRRPAGDSDLARDAGINDIGSSGNSRTGLLDNNSNDDSSRAGFFDNASNDDDQDDMDHDSDGFDSDSDN
jgi:hypothetical protein